MTCDAGTCRVTEAPPDGALGGSCATTACAEGLVCQADRCDDPSCPLGSIGCGCGPFGQCAPLDGRALACVDGKCQIGACAAGTLGCACDNGTCQDQLTCDGDLCRPGAGLALRVSDPAAQACDVLLTEPGDGARRVSEVTFEAHVQGEYLHRSPELALAFISRAPGALGRAVSLRVSAPSGADAWSAALPIVSRAVCYDALGRPLPDAHVTVE
jgi:hypothetical protein